MKATTNRYQVSIEADPTLPIIHIARDFDATPSQWLRARTDPELFARWVGPHSMETEIVDWDATTGGRWRYVTRGDSEEHDSIEARDQWLVSGMETGVDDGYAKLDALVAQLR